MDECSLIHDRARPILRVLTNPSRLIRQQNVWDGAGTVARLLRFAAFAPVVRGLSQYSPSMTVAIAGRSPATFEIKSANLPLVALLLKSADLADLARELAIRFGDIPDFFDHDPLVIDLAPLQAGGDVAVDFSELLHLLRGYRVVPIAVKGGSESQMRSALAAGLAAAPELAVAMPRAAEPPTDEAQAASSGAPRDASAPAADNPQRPELGLHDSEPPSRTARGLVNAPSPSALVIDKPLRSGQQVYARGRDVVVLSMVNAGAEVIADGHIHVYAPLRGKAIAGARGNTEARIFSLCLDPELISIAGVYRTSDVPLPAEVRARPTQVRLIGGAEGKLVMDPIKT
jgi:septum site-determining protein MinC